MIIRFRGALSFADCWTVTSDLDFCNDALFRMLMETLGRSSRFDLTTDLDTFSVVKSFCGHTQNLRKQIDREYHRKRLIVTKCLVFEAKRDEEQLFTSLMVLKLRFA
jgi:hypothetical protein